MSINTSIAGRLILPLARSKLKIVRFFESERHFSRPVAPQSRWQRASKGEDCGPGPGTGRYQANNRSVKTLHSCARPRVLSRTAFYTKEGSPLGKGRS